MSQTVTIASGSTTSPPFTLKHALPFGVLCGSQAGGAITVEFATTSGGAGGTWAALARSDGTGLPFVVTSGSTAWGIVPTPASPWCRVVQTTPAPTPRDFTVYELHLAR